jgi:hypothetical protein
MIGLVLAKSSKWSPPSFPTGGVELAHAKKAKLFSAIEGDALKKVLARKKFSASAKTPKKRDGGGKFGFRRL